MHCCVCVLQEHYIIRCSGSVTATARHGWPTRLKVSYVSIVLIYTTTVMLDYVVCWC